MAKAKTAQGGKDLFKIFMENNCDIDTTSILAQERFREQQMIFRNIMGYRNREQMLKMNNDDEVHVDFLISQCRAANPPQWRRCPENPRNQDLGF